MYFWSALSSSPDGNEFEAAGLASSLMSQWWLVGGWVIIIIVDLLPFHFISEQSFDMEIIIIRVRFSPL